MRKIQSFVRRSGRLTTSQKNALDNLSQHFILNKPYDFVNIWHNNNPIILEIGFGNGDSLIEMAQQNPEFNYIGVEVYEAGIGRIINNAYHITLTNLKVINDDAMDFLKQMPNHFLNGLQLFFPDPWHKKKHHKRRIVNVNFLNLLTQKLKKDAFVHMATDWQEYAQQMMRQFENHPHFLNNDGKNNYNLNNKRPMTKFERRGLKLNHNVWDLIFIKI